MLTNPESRRGLRSLVMAIVVLVLLYFLWEWAEKLPAADLKDIARGSLVLIGIAMVGYQFENGMRAFKLSAGKDGVTIEGNGEGAE